MVHEIETPDQSPRTRVHAPLCSDQVLALDSSTNPLAKRRLTALLAALDICDFAGKAYLTLSVLETTQQSHCSCASLQVPTSDSLVNGLLICAPRVRHAALSQPIANLLPSAGLGRELLPSLPWYIHLVTFSSTYSRVDTEVKLCTCSHTCRGPPCSPSVALSPCI